MNPAHPRRWLALALGLPLACLEYQPPPTSQGELGRGDFTYVCAGSTDALCPEDSAWALAFPQAIALGGAFTLTYEYNAKNAGNPLPSLVTASPSRLAGDEGIFTALVPGYTAILALSGTSQVIDIIHIRTDAIDHLKWSVGDLGLDEALVIEVGQQLSLRAEPQNRQDLRLAGALSYTWTLEDPATLSIIGTASDDRVVLQGLTEGLTKVFVQVGDHIAELPVLVEPGVATSTTDVSTTDASTTDVSTTDASTTDASTTDASTGDTP
jgi:hypothetical protein